MALLWRVEQTKFDSITCTYFRQMVRSCTGIIPEILAKPGAGAFLNVGLVLKVLGEITNLSVVFVQRVSSEIGKRLSTRRPE